MLRQYTRSFDYDSLGVRFLRFGSPAEPGARVAGADLRVFPGHRPQRSESGGSQVGSLGPKEKYGIAGGSGRQTRQPLLLSPVGSRGNLSYMLFTNGRL